MSLNKANQIFIAQSAGVVEYADYISPHQQMSWWWGFSPGALENVENLFYCYYAQVHSEQEW